MAIINHLNYWTLTFKLWMDSTTAGKIAEWTYSIQKIIHSLWWSWFHSFSMNGDLAMNQRKSTQVPKNFMTLEDWSTHTHTYSCISSNFILQIILRVVFSFNNSYFRLVVRRCLKLFYSNWNKYDSVKSFGKLKFPKVPAYV